MKIAVIGIGGVGGYFGGRLAQAGHDVTFIARGKTLEALSTNGLKVDSIEGDFHLKKIRAIEHTSDAGTVDLILIATKAWQVADVAKTLQPLLHKDTIVIPLQNGVESPEILKSEIDEKHIFGGCCKIISYIVEPGYIKHATRPPRILFGELDNKKSERVEKVYDALNVHGIYPTLADDIHVTMWQKLLFISSVSGVGALTRAPFGEIRSYPPTRQMVYNAMQEVVDVAKAYNILLDVDEAAKNLAVLDELDPTQTTSMQRDIMNGNISELDFQNGSVVKYAKKAGVPVPTHEWIYNSLYLMDQQTKKP